MSGPRAGHQANVRLQGPACVWAGRCAVTSTRALTAILPDGNCGTVVAGPSNWTRLLAAVTHSLRTSTHLAAEHPHPRSTTWINVHMTMPEPPHTRHNAGFTGTRQTQPPKKATVPHQKTEKSPYQQHDLSNLIVGSQPTKTPTFQHQKAKSHPSSNTKYPFTRRRRPGRARPSAAPKNDYWAVMSSFVAARSLICPRGTHQTG